jgi:hypothetical protein
MNEYKLENEWTFYIHLQHNSDWSLSSYHKIMKFNNLTDGILLNNQCDSELAKHSLYFVMKNDIEPIWESPDNIEGGVFSFRIPNKDIERVWKIVYYKLIGETLFKDEQIKNSVSGISNSPKKTFCILKIWMKNKKYQSVDIFNLKNIDLSGGRFKSHA